MTTTAYTTIARLREWAGDACTAYAGNGRTRCDGCYCWPDQHEAARLVREAEAAVAGIAEAVVQAVAELPDRTSPDDWPEAMLVTPGELRAILAEALTPAAGVVAEARRARP